MNTADHSNINEQLHSQAQAQTTNQYANNDKSGDIAMPPHIQSFKSADPRRKSPFLAGALSFIPGLGQIYVGYYQRGFINVLVAGSVFSLLVGTGGPDNFALFPLVLIFLIFFEFYNIIDAARRAAMYNLSLAGIEQTVLPDDLSEPMIGGSILGGASLFIFGIIALSNTAFGVPLAWLEAWWPMVPIAFGGYLLYRAYLDANKTHIEAECSLVETASKDL